MVRINKEVKADVQMWLQFLIEFNGQCYIPEKTWLSNDTLEMFTDSSGNPELGCGAYFLRSLGTVPLAFKLEKFADS
jgi:hypothetical protein